VIHERPKVAALAVVLHDNHVLLVRRKNPPDAGLWGFPGGHIELGETGLSAAVRELAEETSVVAVPQRYLTNLDIIEKDGDGVIKHHYLLAAV
jgi:ADP-ribose pyrophosphatase YjhB (NUDIX family)